MKTPHPDGFDGEFFQTYWNTVSLKLFQRTETAKTLPNLFYEVIITLIPKPNKDITRGKIKV